MPDETVELKVTDVNEGDSLLGYIKQFASKYHLDIDLDNLKDAASSLKDY